MSWTPVVPEPARAGIVKADAFMSLCAPKGRRRAFVTVSIRATMLPGMEWFRPGAMVQLLVGAGDHAG